MKGCSTPFSTRRGWIRFNGGSAEKNLATKFVNDVNGVKSVNNPMTIG
jgi:osmotically-inducible protein OsmY